jgi:hypothetical protein
MILVILAICIILFVVGAIMVDTYYEEIGESLAIIGVIAGVISLIATLCLGIAVSNLSVIDDKITMYQEENQKIEMQIAETVEKYQNYESNIIDKVTPESSITLVSLYPELKSDTLIQKQIEVYVNNNDKIKSLKEQQISGNVSRWWLYFGGRKGIE